MLKQSIITMVALTAFVGGANAANIYNPMYKTDAGKFQLVGDFLVQTSSVDIKLNYGITDSFWVNASYAIGTQDAFPGRNEDEYAFVGADFFTIGAGYRIISNKDFKWDVMLDFNIDVIENSMEDNGIYDYDNSSNAVIGTKFGWTPSDKFVISALAEYKLNFSDADKILPPGIFAINFANSSSDYLGLGDDAMYKPTDSFAFGGSFIYNTLHDEEKFTYDYVAKLYVATSAGGIDVAPYVAFYNAADNYAAIGVKVGTQF